MIRKLQPAASKVAQVVKKNVVKLAVVAVVAVSAVSAHAQTGPDPTTIYSGITAPYNASITIAITAIGIGAVIMYIRKGFKARA